MSQWGMIKLQIRRIFPLVRVGCHSRGYLLQRVFKIEPEAVDFKLKITLLENYH